MIKVSSICRDAQTQEAERAALVSAARRQHDDLRSAAAAAVERERARAAK
jgi:hypothetical protein